MSTAHVSTVMAPAVAISPFPDVIVGDRRLTITRVLGSATP
jgi:hypothetical protein